MMERRNSEPCGDSLEGKSELLEAEDVGATAVRRSSMSASVVHAGS